MIRVRKSADRGHADHGWLDAHHSFSFAEFYDPDFMGYRTLRVLNEDRIAPGRGFGKHAHRNMEIVTIVLEGELKHADSLGNGETILPGEVQRMTAGSGVQHSEFNASETEGLHLLQIWIEPDRNELPPSYEQTAFPSEEKLDRLRLVASPDGADGSVTIHQDVRLYQSELTAGATVAHTFGTGRAGWLQVTHGVLDVDGTALVAGDGAVIEEVDALSITAREREDARFLLFDLA